jgi:hypothetical protein
VLCLLGGLSGCGSEPPKLPADPAGLLADVAGHLDTQSTFRLTMDTTVPQTSSTTVGPKPQFTVTLTGMWSTATHHGSMAGQLNGVASTVLAANGVEYVSLTPPQGGKTWLKVDGGGLFGLFDDPRLVSQLLRAYHGVDQAAGARHLSGTIVTAEADTHIADPNLLGALAALPDTVAFDVTADRNGAPTKIVFRLAGDSERTSGTVELRDFGAKAPDFAVPTADQVVEAPRAGG